MILTYKIKHGRDFSEELCKARQIADFAVRHGTSTSKDVKQFGLKSAISNQILRKYGRNKKIKKVSRVNLTIPAQAIRVNDQDKTLWIACLKLKLSYHFLRFTKVNQIEINHEYAFVSVTVPEVESIQEQSLIGVDLNATGHCVVCAHPATGKVWMMGKRANHTHHKYRDQRKHMQKMRKFKVIKKQRHRESRIVRDLNHKMAQKVVEEACKLKAGIVLEDLSNIRKTKKQAKAFRGTLHSWSFYQFRQFVEYKAKLRGIPVYRIDPRYTSQQCSRCGQLGKRMQKRFTCAACGHVAHADVNAAFVIALRQAGSVRLPTDRDVGKGSTDTPQGAM